MDFEVPNFETWPGVDAIQLGHDVLGPGPRGVQVAAFFTEKADCQVNRLNAIMHIGYRSELQLHHRFHGYPQM